eukprot:Rmarinus@m.11015
MPLLKTKKDRVAFRFKVTLHELTHVPLSHGVVYAKIKGRGLKKEWCTRRVRVKQYRVRFEETFPLECEIGVGRETSMLEPRKIRISVRQETKGGSDYSRLGVVQINLSEYGHSVDATKRCLLRQSRLNSALKISITAESDGETQFICPPVTDERVDLDTLTLHSRSSIVGEETGDRGMPDDLSDDGSSHSGSHRPFSVWVADPYAMHLEQTRPRNSDLVEDMCRLLGKRMERTEVANPMHGFMGPDGSELHPISPIAVEKKSSRKKEKHKERGREREKDKEREKEKEKGREREREKERAREREKEHEPKIFEIGGSPRSTLGLSVPEDMLVGSNL